MGLQTDRAPGERRKCYEHLQPQLSCFFFRVTLLWAMHSFDVAHVDSDMWHVPTAAPSTYYSTSYQHHLAWEQPGNYFCILFQLPLEACRFLFPYHLLPLHSETLPTANAVPGSVASPELHSSCWKWWGSCLLLILFVTVVLILQTSFMILFSCLFSRLKSWTIQLLLVQKVSHVWDIHKYAKVLGFLKSS